MSMALALEFTAEWFREKYGFTVEQCAVSESAKPPLNAGQFFVGIEDGGVEPGNDSTDSLREILSLRIGVWRRPEHMSKILRGNLKLPRDKWLAGAWTLHELERKVIVHKQVSGVTVEGMHGLHGNYEFMNRLNARYSLPVEENGAAFIFPLLYRGRGQIETTAIDGGTDIESWYGYILRFRGLSREQKFRGLTDAIG